MRFVKCIPVILLAIFSCEDGGTLIKARLAFAKSEMKWSEFKEKNGNSYVYESTFLSFAGNGSTTEITVEEGVVTGRSLELFQYENGERVVTLSYEETDEEVGTHDFGEKPLTIDQLYQKCGTEYLRVSHEDNEVVFETNEFGIISVCGYWPKRVLR